MSVSGIGSVHRSEQRLLAAPRPSFEGSDDRLLKETASRSLLPLLEQAAASEAIRVDYRPAAAFVAHVIATFQGAPQTRQRNRASGQEAATAYRLVQALVEQPL